MRVTLRPRTLAALGLTLLGTTVLLDRFVYGSGSTPDAEAPTTVVTTSPVTEPQPFAIDSVRLLDATAYGARVEWVTTEPSTGSARFGPTGMEPVLWTAPAAAAALRHVERLDGLAASTPYTVSISARSAAGEPVSTQLSFTTPAAPTSLQASVEDGVVRVDGAAFLPLLVWQQCPDRFMLDLDVGINLFAGTQCVGLQSLTQAVTGKALVATAAEDGAETTGASVVGWFYPDEADARGLTGETLPAAPPGLRFLTVTQHFFAGAAPLPSGRGMYPGLFDRADVVGFDLYPLQELCRPELLPLVFDAQRELVGLVPGKPTFQWIEAREFKCPQTAVTPDAVRAESWLALAGGARGLGFFPKDWGPGVAEAIAGVTARIRQLEPAILAPPRPVRVEGAGAAAVRASARESNGALYVLAVNGAAAPARVELHVPGLAGRPLRVLGSTRTVAPAGDAFAARLPPLGVRLFVAAPPG